METTNKPNKANRIVYWIATGMIALFVLPGIFYLNSPMAMQGMAHLGIPGWLHYEAGVGQFIAALLILLPAFFGNRLKEWAYVGLGIVYLSAFIAHLAIDGPIGMSFAPLLLFAVLLVSYITWHKAQTK